MHEYSSSLVGYQKTHIYSGKVRKYYDVKNHAFFQNVRRDFGHFYAQFSFNNNKNYDRCENRAFSMRNMRVFITCPNPITAFKPRIFRWKFYMQSQS